MKYRLNYDFMSHKKGEIIESETTGFVRVYRNPRPDDESILILPEVTNLLLLSGALTEVKENTCMHHTNPYNCDCFKNLGKEKEEECPQLPEELPIREVSIGEKEIAETHVRLAVNSITRYLKHHKEK